MLRPPGGYSTKATKHPSQKKQLITSLGGPHRAHQSRAHRSKERSETLRCSRVCIQRRTPSNAKTVHIPVVCVSGYPPIHIHSRKVSPSNLDFKSHTDASLPTPLKEGFDRHSGDKHRVRVVSESLLLLSCSSSARGEHARRRIIDTNQRVINKRSPTASRRGVMGQPTTTPFLLDPL